MEWENEMKNLIKVWLLVILSLCYCYYVASKLPKGKLKLLSLLPIFYLFTILPLSLSSVLPTGITVLFITWLANFKLLLFSFDLGPLSSDPPNSLLLFISIACLPIKIKQNKHYPSLQNQEKTSKFLPNLPSKVLLFAILLCAYDYKCFVHPNGILVIYCFMLFLFVDVIMGLCNAVVRALIGMELEPPSDEPYFSTSLQDFWGRRWNLTVTNTLRHTVYKPMRSVLDNVIGRDWAALPAVVAAFLVSGLMHELLFFYVTRVNPTWEVTCFFSLHGVAVVVELGVKKAVTGRRPLHRAVSGSLAVGFVVVTSIWLFFPPLIRSGTDVRAIEEFKSLMNFVEEKLKTIV